MKKISKTIRIGMVPRQENIPPKSIGRYVPTDPHPQVCELFSFQFQRIEKGRLSPKNAFLHILKVPT